MVVPFLIEVFFFDTLKWSGRCRGKRSVSAGAGSSRHAVFRCLNLKLGVRIFLLLLIVSLVTRQLRQRYGRVNEFWYGGNDVLHVMRARVSGKYGLDEIRLRQT